MQVIFPTDKGSTADWDTLKPSREKAIPCPETMGIDQIHRENTLQPLNPPNPYTRISTCRLKSPHDVHHRISRARILGVLSYLTLCSYNCCAESQRNHTWSPLLAATCSIAKPFTGEGENILWVLLRARH